MATHSSILPGEFHGQRSLAGYSPCNLEESELAVLGLLGCTWAFSSCGEWGLLSRCGTRASYCSGFSCCRAQAVGHTGFSSCGSRALGLRLSSCAVQVQLLNYRSLIDHSDQL